MYFPGKTLYLYDGKNFSGELNKVIPPEKLIFVD